MTPLLLAFVAGLLTVLAPCTLPVVPLVLGGGSLGGRRRAVGIALGFGGTFVATAVLVASILAAAGVTTAPLRTAAAVALGILGLCILFPALGAWTERRLAPAARLVARVPGGDDGLLPAPPKRLGRCRRCRPRRRR